MLIHSIKYQVSIQTTDCEKCVGYNLCRNVKALPLLNQMVLATPILSLFMELE